MLHATLSSAALRAAKASGMRRLERSTSTEAAAAPSSSFRAPSSGMLGSFALRHTTSGRTAGTTASSTSFHRAASDAVAAQIAIGDSSIDDLVDEIVDDDGALSQAESVSHAGSDSDDSNDEGSTMNIWGSGVRPTAFNVGGVGITIAVPGAGTSAAGRTSSDRSMAKKRSGARKRSMGRRGSGVHENVRQGNMPRAPSMYGKRKRPGSASNGLTHHRSIGKTILHAVSETKEHDAPPARRRGRRSSGVHNSLEQKPQRSIPRAPSMYGKRKRRGSSALENLEMRKQLLHSVAEQDSDVKEGSDDEDGSDDSDSSDHNHGETDEFNPHVAPLTPSASRTRARRSSGVHTTVHTASNLPRAPSMYGKRRRQPNRGRAGARERAKPSLQVVVEANANNYTENLFLSPSRPPGNPTGPMRSPFVPNPLASPFTPGAAAARSNGRRGLRGSGVHDSAVLVASAKRQMPRAPSMYAKRKRKGSTALPTALVGQALLQTLPEVTPTLEEGEEEEDNGAPGDVLHSSLSASSGLVGVPEGSEEEDEEEADAAGGAHLADVAEGKQEEEEEEESGDTLGALGVPTRRRGRRSSGVHIGMIPNRMPRQPSSYGAADLGVSGPVTPKTATAKSRSTFRSRPVAAAEPGRSLLRSGIGPKPVAATAPGGRPSRRAAQSAARRRNRRRSSGVHATTPKSSIPRAPSMYGRRRRKGSRAVEDLKLQASEVHDLHDVHEHHEHHHDEHGQETKQAPVSGVLSPHATLGPPLRKGMVRQPSLLPKRKRKGSAAHVARQPRALLGTVLESDGGEENKNAGYTSMRPTSLTVSSLAPTTTDSFEDTEAAANRLRSPFRNTDLGANHFVRQPSLLPKRKCKGSASLGPVKPRAVLGAVMEDAKGEERAVREHPSPGTTATIGRSLFASRNKLMSPVTRRLSPLDGNGATTASDGAATMPSAPPPLASSLSAPAASGGRRGRNRRRSSGVHATPPTKPMVTQKSFMPRRRRRGSSSLDGVDVASTPLHAIPADRSKTPADAAPASPTPQPRRRSTTSGRGLPVDMASRRELLARIASTTNIMKSTRSLRLETAAVSSAPDEATPSSTPRMPVLSPRHTPRQPVRDGAPVPPRRPPSSSGRRSPRAPHATTALGGDGGVPRRGSRGRLRAKGDGGSSRHDEDAGVSGRGSLRRMFAELSASGKQLRGDDTSPLHRHSSRKSNRRQHNSQHRPAPAVRPTSATLSRMSVQGSAMTAHASSSRRMVLSPAPARPAAAPAGLIGGGLSDGDRASRRHMKRGASNPLLPAVRTPRAGPPSAPVKHSAGVPHGIHYATSTSPAAAATNQRRGSHRSRRSHRPKSAKSTRRR